MTLPTLHEIDPELEALLHEEEMIERRSKFVKGPKSWFVIMPGLRAYLGYPNTSQTVGLLKCGRWEEL